MLTSEDIMPQSCMNGVSVDKPVVCVVDDDASVCTALARLMKSAGLDVKTFTSAQNFLDQGCRDATGCLVLDVRMPGIGGLELQEKLLASDRRIPIIFISAHKDCRAREQGLDAGAVAFLQKPFEDQILIEAVHSALSQFQVKGDSYNCKPA